MSWRFIRGRPAGANRKVPVNEKIFSNLVNISGEMSRWLEIHDMSWGTDIQRIIVAIKGIFVPPWQRNDIYNGVIRKQI